MVVEQQISARRERARRSILRILTWPDGNVYGDYSVRSASNKTYRVAMRGPGLFDNYCSCPHFAVNTLGTCKRIETLLVRLRRRRGEALDREVFNRARASLSLHYGDTPNMRLRLPRSPSPALLALAREYFDDLGLLKSSHLRDFGKLMDELRKADDQAVIYSDVLNYVDREDEIAEGRETEKKLPAVGTPLALIELGYYRLAKNSREQQTLCCAIFKTFRSLFCDRKHCLDNMFVAEEAFVVFKYMN